MSRKSYYGGAWATAQHGRGWHAATGWEDWTGEDRRRSIRVWAPQTRETLDSPQDAWAQWAPGKGSSRVSEVAQAGRSIIGQRANPHSKGLGQREKPHSAGPEPSYESSRLTAEKLVTFPESMQKSLLGESLYLAILRLVTGSDATLASKVTGMLLEMDNSDLLVLLENDQMLKLRVDDAVQLLEESVDDDLMDEICKAAHHGGGGEACTTSTAPSRRGIVGDLDGAEYVSQGISLPCALMAQATLEGRRLLESRTWKIPHGWYALHAGCKRLPEEWKDAVRLSWPDAPSEDVFLGDVIGGLVYIDQDVPEDRCRGSAWARAGLSAHLVSKVIVLPRAVRCSGSGGLWPLPQAVVDDIVEQLPDLAITYFDVSGLRE